MIDDGAAGRHVAVQVGQERVLRDVDDHRGPDPDAAALVGGRRRRPRETTVNDPLAPIVRPRREHSASDVSEPMRAVVWSLAITIAMPAPTATEPAAPFFAVVVIVWGELAVTVTLPAPVRPAPSWISDSVVSEMMFRASDAPTPTLAARGAAVGRRHGRSRCRPSCSARSTRRRRRRP